MSIDTRGYALAPTGISAELLAACDSDTRYGFLLSHIGWDNHLRWVYPNWQRLTPLTFARAFREFYPLWPAKAVEARDPQVRQAAVRSLHKMGGR